MGADTACRKIATEYVCVSFRLGMNKHCMLPGWEEVVMDWKRSP